MGRILGEGRIYTRFQSMCKISVGHKILLYPTSVSGGEHLITGVEHISRLMRRMGVQLRKTLIERFCFRQNLNNGVIIEFYKS